ncbi:MAG: Asp-tRNA(Asn)/Glu-tRNA(Gln) amidotransferase subunit GatB [Deltaproteobacteria bacterium]|nr:Asp-tRNA(Asn)/Glu-tRNA(Gln) amidotransferase subunit GatB [Deltaproteobacteria bacterium]
MRYEPVIGLEVHAQLLTESKLFCQCPTRFGKEPNTQVCPVCLGMPGVLPVLNKKAVEFAVKTALATNCEVNEKSVFARKNYFYPDLPKGYQISQYEEPLSAHGHIEIETPAGKKMVRITRIHMEEDAGKLVHNEGPSDAGASLVDLNWAGVPLIEIVSEPDISTPEEAAAYLKAIRDILVYLEVCDGNMEEGSFRCDANVSIRPVDCETLGTKAELKNINSFTVVKDAIAYEIERQIGVVEQGGRIVQETRLFDSSKGITISMRSKEEAHDYRYFPEPDLLPLIIDNVFMEDVRRTLPELPAEKRARFIRDYSLPPYDAGVLTQSRELADYFESCAKLTGDPKTTSNWVMGELLRHMKEDARPVKDCPVSPENMASLIAMIKKGEISLKMAKDVFEEIYKTSSSPAEVVKKMGVAQISDESLLIEAIDKALDANPADVERYKKGEEKLLGFFIGQVMKTTKGQANPQTLQRLLKERLIKTG